MNTPITFPIAKLLKEKGFDKVMKYHYPNLSIEKQEIYLPTNWNKFTYMSGNSEYYSAPTIAEVIMWLYEKHGIWIWVNPYKDHAADNNEPYKAQMNVFKNGITVSKEYRTPTEAYSKAIEYVLTNL